MAISDWPEGERPRERLLVHGPARLSDAELLAICLRTGVAGASAVSGGRTSTSWTSSTRGNGASRYDGSEPENAIAPG